MTYDPAPYVDLVMDCHFALATINAHAARIRTGIHQWEPKPCPPSPTHPETGERK